VIESQTLSTTCNTTNTFVILFSSQEQMYKTAESDTIKTANCKRHEQCYYLGCILTLATCLQLSCCF